jgi:hypothetical protein
MKTQMSDPFTRKDTKEKRVFSGPIGSLICFLSHKNEDLQMDLRAPTLIMHAYGMFHPDVLFVNLNLLNCI